MYGVGHDLHSGGKGLLVGAGFHGQRTTDKGLMLERIGLLKDLPGTILLAVCTRDNRSIGNRHARLDFNIKLAICCDKLAERPLAYRLSQKKSPSTETRYGYWTISDDFDGLTS